MSGAVRWILLAVAMALLPPVAAAAAEFHGKVVAVADGDTLEVLVDGRARRVRLAGIDAPERGQPYGGAARRALAQLVAGRDVQVILRGTDTFGRTLGGVRVDALDVNAELVRLGHAWVFRRYEQDATLLALESDARAARRGLWRDADPVPPWIWRETHARPRHAAVAPAHSPPGER